MTKTKAIIPVAGAGTKLRPFTYTQPKALIPVAGKPIISFIIDDLIANGVTDFIFIVGYFGEKIVDYVQENYKDIHSEFIYQQHREGLGHAIYLAKDLIVDSDELIIALGDSIVEVSNQFFDQNQSQIVIKKVKEPQHFGVVEIDEKGGIIKFVEKPQFPKSNEALVGWYKIVEVEKLVSILDKFVKDNIRTNGEIQLTDVLNEMLNDQVQFNLLSADQWLDVGNGDVLLNSNALLLKKFGGKTASTAMIENVVIIHPVFIAENCKLTNSIIGPNVTLGAHTKIDQSILENGIIGSFSNLKKMKLKDFVIGSDSSLSGATQTITVGDNTEIDFSK